MNVKRKSTSNEIFNFFFYFFFLNEFLFQFFCLLYRHKWILLTHISLTTVYCKWDVMSVVLILFFYWLCMHPVALHRRRQVGDGWVVIAFHICCLLIKGIKIPFCLSSQRKEDWGDLFCLSSSLLHFLLHFDNQVAWFVIIPTFSSFMKDSFKWWIILKKQLRWGWIVKKKKKNL